MKKTNRITKEREDTDKLMGEGQPVSIYILLPRIETNKREKITTKR